MTIGHQYLYSKWYTFAQAMTPLHGGATNGLKSGATVVISPGCTETPTSGHDVNCNLTNYYTENLDKHSPTSQHG